MYSCAYNYQWDPQKNRENYSNHGIWFADAITVFLDESAHTMEDDYQNEERFITMGMDAECRILVVVYTWRGNDVRIISARKATRKERKEYGRKR